MVWKWSQKDVLMPIKLHKKKMLGFGGVLNVSSTINTKIIVVAVAGIEDIGKGTK